MLARYCISNYERSLQRNNSQELNGLYFLPTSLVKKAGQMSQIEIVTTIHMVYDTSFALVKNIS